MPRQRCRFDTLVPCSPPTGNRDFILSPSYSPLQNAQSSQKMYPSTCSQPMKSAVEPCYLPVPIIQPIHMDDIVAVAPEFEGLPIEAVMEELASRETRNRYIQGLELRDARCNAPLSTPYPSSSAIPPTHLLVAHDSRGGMSLAYPCHDILIAAHFALLEPAPAPVPQLEGFEQRQDIMVPFPAAFDVLREYIYTHSSQALMSRLLSMDGSLDNEQAAVAFSQMGAEEITKRWGRLFEVYEDASYLGMVDVEFWKSIQSASWILARGLHLWKESQVLLDSEA